MMNLFESERGKLHWQYLVTLLVRVAPVAVREVDVAVSLGHDAPDRVPSLTDDVTVVSVAHVHLHRDSGVSRGVQHLSDHHLGPHHALLSPAANTDVRILLALSANLQPEIGKLMQVRYTNIDRMSRSQPTLMAR